MTNLDENVFHTCRSCLLLSNDTYPIFDTAIEDNITVATLLNYFLIELEEDELPQTLCHSCLSKLQAAYDFFEMFKKSQAILQQRFVENQQEEHIMILNDNSNLNVVFKNNIKEAISIEETSLDIKQDIVEIEENIIVKYGESDNESHDSDDEEYLVATSVKLTEMYKRRKCANGTDTDSDDNIKEPENDSDLTSKKTTFASNSNSGDDIHNETLEESSDNALTCKVCSECFVDVNSYLEHQCKKEFFCHVCEKTFPRVNAYKKHMRKHSTSAPKFFCPDKNCSKTFCGKQALRSHYLTIHGEKRNYLCSLCGASFKNYDNLRYHIKKHKGPSHVCSYCGKAFMLSAHLKDHMWRHLGVKPHKCTKCGKGFLSKRVLKRHVERNCKKEKKSPRSKLLLNVESA